MHTKYRTLAQYLYVKSTEIAYIRLKRLTVPLSPDIYKSAEGRLRTKSRQDSCYILMKLYLCLCQRLNASTKDKTFPHLHCAPWHIVFYICLKQCNNYIVFASQPPQIANNKGHRTALFTLHTSMGHTFTTITSHFIFP